MARGNSFFAKSQRQLGRKMRFQRRIYRHSPEEGYQLQIALWMLRFLVLSEAETEDFLAAEWFRNILGIELSDIQNLKGAEVIRMLKDKLKKMDKGAIHRKGSLFSNIDRLGKLVGLSSIDKEILAFAVLSQTYNCLQECMELFEDLNISTAHQILAEILSLNPKEVSHSLKEDSALCSSGILTCDILASNLSMLTLLDGLNTALLGDTSDGDKLFQTYFTPSRPSTLTSSDFPHLQKDLEFLQELLKKTESEGIKGINILIYGEPGTGKTEFAKVLASSLNAMLLEVSHENESSDLDEKQGRFRSFLLAQKVLARKHNTLIMFDEVEDVFPDSVLEFFGRAQHSGRYKAWTNSVLESNPRPAFWICNEIYQIDPAFRRRFTYTLHVRKLVRSVRRNILTKHLGNLQVREEWIDKISENPNLTPAMIEKACKVASWVEKRDPASVEHLIERSFKSSLEVMGFSRELTTAHYSSATHYSLEYLNSEINLEELTGGLKKRPYGRLCFYGPPGSGKTAFAHYLSGQVDKPLILKQASDILSCFVGGTEKYIAEMFREAKEENAILLLDEADSFLQDRRGAHRTWEITQVNELLTQMEKFDGLFICSTNLMDSLDQAVLRRFDLKIRFEFLMPEQASRLFLQSLDMSGRNVDDPDLLKDLHRRLKRLNNLTPGDFATIIRKAHLFGHSFGAEHFLAELESECRMKKGKEKAVKGFCP